MEQIISSEVLGDLTVIPPSYQICIYGDRGAYLQGINQVKSYSPTVIEVIIKNGELKISGENLYIKKYCVGDLSVCGKIKKVERI